MTTSRLLPRVLLLASLTLPAAAGDTSGTAWSGAGCACEDDLRQLVDAAFAAAPAAEVLMNGNGPGAAGFAVAVLHPECGVFLYSVGLRDVENQEPMLNATRNHIASMTKPVTTAIVLGLADAGLLGPQGLDASVDLFFSPQEIHALTVGADPFAPPKCPDVFQTPDKLTRDPELGFGLCPDFSQRTVRDLLTGNHGLWDSYNELDRNFNLFPESNDYVFDSLFSFIGLPHDSLPPGTDDAFDLLSALGVLANPNATIGGDTLEDFEISFGNTGFALLGLIAERVSGLSYDQLAGQFVTGPLALDPMNVLDAVPVPEGDIARQYTLTTGSGLFLIPLPEDLFGVYPQTSINGNPAINVYDLDAFIATNGGGGGGALVTTARGYVRFFDALVTGGLLSPAGQAAFDGAFVPVVIPVPGFDLSHGFGVFREPVAGLGTVFRKGGSTAGTESEALHSDVAAGGNGVTVVVCRNSDDLFLPNAGVPATAGDVEDLAEDLARAARP